MTDTLHHDALVRSYSALQRYPHLGGLVRWFLHEMGDEPEADQLANEVLSLPVKDVT